MSDKEYKIVHFITDLGFDEITIDGDDLQTLKQYLIKCEKLQEENERLIEELDLKTDFIQDLLISISYSRDNELHNKCYKKGKIYQEKLDKLKGSDKK